MVRGEFRKAGEGTDIPWKTRLAMSDFYKVWNFKIEDFHNKDTYLYLLNLKKCAYFFYAIATITMTMGFSLIYTAGIVENTNVYKKFKSIYALEQIIITNIPSTLHTRIWVLYYLAWLIILSAAYLSITQIRDIAITTLSEQTDSPKHINNLATRFRANTCTVLIYGIHKYLASPDPIYHALMAKFQPKDIANIHLIRDYSKSLKAFRRFNKHRKTLQQIYEKIHHFHGPPKPWYKCFLAWRNQENEDQIEEETTEQENTVDPLKTINRLATRSEYSSINYSTQLDGMKYCIEKPAASKPKNSLNLDRNSNFCIWSQIRGSRNIMEYYPTPSELIKKVISNNKPDKKLNKLLVKYTKEYGISLNLFDTLQWLSKTLPERNVGMAFVCFTSIAACEFAMSNNLNDVKKSFSPVPKQNNINIWKKSWKIAMAPPPSDIIWENIHITSGSRLFRSIVLNLAVATFILIVTSSIFVADAVAPLVNKIELFLDNIVILSNYINGLLLPNLMYAINYAILPLLVTWAAKHTLYWRASSFEKSVMRSNVAYLILNMVFLPLVEATSLSTLFYYLSEKNAITILRQIGLNAALASGGFILRNLINTTLVSTTMQLLQLPTCIFILVNRLLKRSFSLWQFNFGSNYAFHVSFFVICLIFSLHCPIIPLIAGMFFSLKYWTEKYNFSNGLWMTRHESSGTIAYSALTQMFGYQSLFILVATGYFTAILISTNLESNNKNYSPTKLGPAIIAFLVILIMEIICVIGLRAQRTLYKHNNFIYRISKKILVKIFGNETDNLRYQNTEIIRLSPHLINEIVKAYTHPIEQSIVEYQH